MVPGTFTFVGRMELQTILDSTNVKANIKDPTRHNRGIVGGARKGTVKKGPRIYRIIDGVLFPKSVHRRWVRNNGKAFNEAAEWVLDTGM